MIVPLEVATVSQGVVWQLCLPKNRLGLRLKKIKNKKKICFTQKPDVHLVQLNCLVQLNSVHLNLVHLISFVWKEFCSGGEKTVRVEKKMFISMSRGSS